MNKQEALDLLSNLECLDDAIIAIQRIYEDWDNDYFELDLYDEIESLWVVLENIKADIADELHLEFKEDDYTSLPDLKRQVEDLEVI
jgi:hypothetical protein